MEEFFLGFTNEDVRSVMVGTSIDFDKVMDVNSMRVAAVHCCLNGPVGVGKLTNFPGLEEEIKLKDLYDGRLSNKMWRNFCRVVGEHLIRNYPDEVADSQQQRLHDAIWPLNEDED
jgi:hypothetical protein